MKACLKRGIGFTLCPEVSVEEELKQKNLVRLTFKGDNDEASLIMIWHSEKWCSPLLNHFMKLSEDVIS